MVDLVELGKVIENIHSRNMDVSCLLTELAEGFSLTGNSYMAEPLTNIARDVFINTFEMQTIYNQYLFSKVDSINNSFRETIEAAAHKE